MGQKVFKSLNAGGRRSAAFQALSQRAAGRTLNPKKDLLVRQVKK